VGGESPSSPTIQDDLRFEGVAASPWAAGRQATVDSAAFLRQRTALLAAAEVAGACRRMVEMTRDYLLVRTQFGQLLGSYQSLKHRLADNHVRVEALAAAIDYAAAASDAAAGDAEACICAAKHFAGRAGKAVADSTLQMHGAIGYTMEFPCTSSCGASIAWGFRTALRARKAKGCSRFSGKWRKPCLADAGGFSGP
jgi:alkylation response protein AidB-like acyl-CoA dehydrogenase